MPNLELELRPVDFITVGTVGPKGRRVFHLQAAKGDQLITLILEKVQAGALAEAIKELLDDLSARQSPAEEALPPAMQDMNLREPIEPEFRVAQMGLGYDEDSDLIVVVAQEMTPPDEEEETDPLLRESADRPSVARFWGTRATMRALAEQAAQVVQQGRPDPQQNGRILYYWT